MNVTDSLSRRAAQNKKDFYICTLPGKTIWFNHIYFKYTICMVYNYYDLPQKIYHYIKLHSKTQQSGSRKRNDSGTKRPRVKRFRANRGGGERTQCQYFLILVLIEKYILHLFNFFTLLLHIHILYQRKGVKDCLVEVSDSEF